MQNVILYFSLFFLFSVSLFDINIIKEAIIIFAFLWIIWGSSKFILFYIKKEMYHRLFWVSNLCLFMELNLVVWKNDEKFFEKFLLSKLEVSAFQIMLDTNYKVAQLFLLVGVYCIVYVFLLLNIFLALFVIAVICIFYITIRFETFLITSVLSNSSKSFYIYCFFLTIVSCFGFYKLIIIDDWYIVVPHLMHIGPMGAPWGYPYCFINASINYWESQGPLNMMQHDLFFYLLMKAGQGGGTMDLYFESIFGSKSQSLDIINMWSLANGSRAFFSVNGVTDHSPQYVPGFIKWDAAIKELMESGGCPSGLTKEQAVFFWIIISDLLPHLSVETLVHLKKENILISDLAMIFDQRLFPFQFFLRKNMDVMDMLIYTDKIKGIREMTGRPSLTASGLHSQFMILCKLSESAQFVSKDPMFLRGLGYWVPALERTQLPPVVERSMEVGLGRIAWLPKEIDDWLLRNNEKKI